MNEETAVSAAWLSRIYPLDSISSLSVGFSDYLLCTFILVMASISAWKILTCWHKLRLRLRYNKRVWAVPEVPLKSGVYFEWGILRICFQPILSKPEGLMNAKVNHILALRVQKCMFYHKPHNDHHNLKVLKKVIMNKLKWKCKSKFHNVNMIIIPEPLPSC